MTAPAAPRFDVLSVGNALVDVITHAEDAFVEGLGLAKGSMALVDAATLASLSGVIGPGVQMSGGSAASTAVGVASLGGASAFVGKVGDDELGRVFASDIRAAGVAFDAAPAGADTTEGTGRCLVLVHPDAQRTMSTYLGVAGQLSADDVHDQVVAAAAVVYLEGYLWDPPGAREALRAAAAAARASGRRVAFTLSDSFLVDRHREDFLAFITEDVDVLFANDDELRSLVQVDDVATAVDRVAERCEIVATTLGAEGSIVAHGSERHRVAVVDVGGVVDTTGAGDLYAAGFLHGLSHGFDLDRCGRVAGIAAAEVISHVGGRPQRNLAELVAELL